MCIFCLSNSEERKCSYSRLIVGRHKNDVVVDGEHLVDERLVDHHVVEATEQMLELDGRHAQLGGHMLEMDEQDVGDLCHGMEERILLD